MPKPPWPAHKTIAADPDLGAVSDIVLARKYDVSREYVRQVRTRLGFAAVATKPRPQRALATASGALGKQSDACLAKMLGISAPTVAIARRELGIAPARRDAPLRDAVLVALAAGHSRASDIHAATGEVHWPNTARALRKLVDAGQVVKISRGRYALKGV